MRNSQLFLTGLVSLSVIAGLASVGTAGDWWWWFGRDRCREYRQYHYPSGTVVETRAYGTPARVAEKDIVEMAQSADSFGTLVTALKAAGLVETLQGKGPFTVFAPTDDAFAKLPSGTLESLLEPENKAKLTTILTYHVVPGRVMARDVVKLDSAKSVAGPAITIAVTENAVRVDEAKVIQTDIACSNGVIHAIDSVIMPPDVVDIAAGSNSFKTLVAAIKAADLVETLKGDGPFTVFAPTNAAFDKLPEGTLKSLLEPENKNKLQGILTYHVVPGKVLAADVVKMKAAKTVNGQQLTIETRGEAVMVDGARVIQTDILGSNGVVHVIDRVVLPKE